MNPIVPELLVAGIAVGALLGFSGFARTLGKAAAGVVALMALWVIVTQGPYAVISQARSWLELATPYVDLMVGVAGGLLIAAGIAREMKRSRRT